VRFDLVTSISDNAFNGCTALNTIFFPAVRTIGDYAFQNCIAMTTANFNNATTIGADAFAGCTALMFANFHKAPSIWANAFNGCTNLQNADFSAATSIKAGAFANTGSTGLDIYLGQFAPELETGIFSGAAAGKNVLVRVPQEGASGYDGTWQDKLKPVDSSGNTVNLNISGNG
jgi:hypothetical protein